MTQENFLFYYRRGIVAYMRYNQNWHVIYPKDLLVLLACGPIVFIIKLNVIHCEILPGFKIHNFSKEFYLAI